MMLLSFPLVKGRGLGCLVIAWAILLPSQKWEDSHRHVDVLSARVGGWKGMLWRKGTVRGVVLGLLSTDNTSDEARNFSNMFIIN